jgi:predicted nuclease with RNAse H fold
VPAVERKKKGPPSQAALSSIEHQAGYTHPYTHDRWEKHLRDCDRELQRRGIRFFPITLSPMRMLIERSLALKQKLSTMGYQSVEYYPSAAQDLWGLRR